MQQACTAAAISAKHVAGKPVASSRYRRRLPSTITACTRESTTQCGADADLGPRPVQAPAPRSGRTCSKRSARPLLDRLEYLSDLALLSLPACARTTCHQADRFPGKVPST